MLKEFKEFISRGNVMDLAVGVVIGGAFQKIVTSLVEDIIMPAISVLTGKIDFSDMMFSVGGASIKYGNFITTIVNFLIISFSIFLVVKYINKLNKIKEIGDLAVNKLNKNGQKVEETEKIEEPKTKICPHCLSEIKYHATRCPYCTSELGEIKEQIKE
mgnify:FL=1